VTTLTLTKHAKQRMSQRIITLQDIYNTVKCGTPEPTSEGKTKYTYQNIYVILSKNKSVITACFTKSYTKQLEKYAKQNNIGFYAAIREMRREII